jgi:hypothetical protein
MRLVVLINFFFQIFIMIIIIHIGAYDQSHVSPHENPHWGRPTQVSQMQKG